MRVTVVGAGSWGTAVAGICATNADVVLWGRSPDLVAAVAATRENARYLPGYRLPDRVRCEADLPTACRDADVVVMAVPSHGFRAVLTAAAPALARDVTVVSLTKGVEGGTHARMTEIVAAVLPHHPDVAVLTGPNLVGEIAAGQPTASVVASGRPEVASALQRLFSTPTFRIYTNTDVVGCEVAGAMKNVIALAVGAAAGFGYGDNTRAALITRGLAEMTRLGVALGGDPLTFAGLAGVGDLVATCSSERSRNRRVGYEFGRGRPLAEIVADSPQVAEGLRTAVAVSDLAATHGVELPITDLVRSVVEGHTVPADVLEVFMGRQAKAELDGMRPA